MGQTECRGNQGDHRVLVVEVQAEGTAGGPHRWKCRGRQTDYRICGLLRLSCYWAHSGRPEPEPDTAETWLQPCEPGKQGQRVMDLYWVKDPAQVWPQTKMPSLRLTD